MRPPALGQETRSMFEIKHRTAKSKINCEELDALPFPGVGIELDTVLGFSVLRRRLRIQHLKWISAPGCAGKDAVSIFLSNCRRGWRGPRFCAGLGGGRPPF